uniref:Uncharacterized protein n=1 Tax=Meloidogyne enterolobii TaxID=390850 RepID=A0A6V7XEK0_MELEN|nr:unnamed protein product [Meloidogyne enterolobii]
MLDGGLFQFLNLLLLFFNMLGGMLFLMSTHALFLNRIWWLAFCYVILVFHIFDFFGKFFIFKN